jgi:hypothetical protein
MLSQKGSCDLSRRRFISQVLPACSLVCLGCSSHLLGFSPSVAKALQKAKHKFDKEFPMKLTNRQLMTFMYTRDYIPLLNFLAEEIGKERLIKMLKEHTAEKSLGVGKMMAGRAGGNSFADLKKIFSPDSQVFKDTLTFTITEDTENAYEINVTECITASVFLKAKSGDFGWATVCYGDYAMATGFNPKIKMVRDKTLMQGDAYCNHRYLLEA